MRSAKKFLHELILRFIKVSGDVSQDRRQSTDLDGIVIGDGNMMLSVLLGGKPYMAPRLPARSISVRLEVFDQLLTADIPGHSHAAITSSRTI